MLIKSLESDFTFKTQVRIKVWSLFVDLIQSNPGRFPVRAEIEILVCRKCEREKSTNFKILKCQLCGIGNLSKIYKFSSKENDQNMGWFIKKLFKSI